MIGLAMLWHIMAYPTRPAEPLYAAALEEEWESQERLEEAA